MNNFETLEQKVISWALEKNLLSSENSKNQFVKTVEEIGEVARALVKNDKSALIDGIGDVIVTLIILAKQNDLSIDKCLESAWNEIKNRQGNTINGIFIKK